MNDDGTYTNCNATINEGKITFTTNHFSTFIIVEQANDSVIKDTGENPMVFVYLAMLLSGIAVVELIRRR